MRLLTLLGIGCLVEKKEISCRDMSPDMIVLYLISILFISKILFTFLYSPFEHQGWIIVHLLA